MNSRYITVVSRDEFIKLYRFGAINISRNFILKRNNNIENNLIELFKNLSYSEPSDYLIININESNYDKNLEEIVYKLELQNIKKVEVLSEKAERFYRTKVNHKVNYYLTSYSNIFPTIEKYQELKDMNRGVDILFEQFNINTPKEKIEEELKINFKEQFLEKEKEKDDSVSININFYWYLLCYKREIKLEKDDTSFIYDMMMLSFKKEGNIDILEKLESGILLLSSSTTYQILETNKQNNIFEYISFIISSKNENIQKFLAQIEEKNLIVGSIFLKIKSLLDEKEDNENYWKDVVNIVNICPVEYKKELAIALYFIGLIFGYRGLYDNYYDFLEKKRDEEKLKTSNNSEDIDDLKEKIDELQSEKIQAEEKAKAELERVQKEKDSIIEELEKAKKVSDKEKVQAQEKAKDELEKLQQEKDSKIEELEKAKKVSDKEKVQAEEKAKDELEKLQKEKDSKIEELEKAKKVSDKEKVQAEEKAKDELERVQKEKDSKIEELEKVKATLESEKNDEIKKLKEEQKARDIKIEELKNSKVTIQELIKIESKVEPQKETIDDILKEIMNVKELQHIVKELNIKSTAKTVGGLKKAIKKACSSDEKIDTFKIIVSQEKGLFELCS